MPPRKKPTPQQRDAWKEFDKVSRQQTKILMQLLKDATIYRAQYDQLQVQLHEVLTALELAQVLFAEAMKEHYPVILLPSAKKGED